MSDNSVQSPHPASYEAFKTQSPKQKQVEVSPESEKKNIPSTQDNVRPPRYECIQSDLGCTCQVRLPFADEAEDPIIVHNGQYRNLPKSIPHYQPNKTVGPGLRYIAPARTESDIDTDDRHIEHFECFINEDVYYLKAVMMWSRTGVIHEHTRELQELQVRIAEVDRWLGYMTSFVDRYNIEPAVLPYHEDH
ncbi:hypothetical protein K435DRAFT_871615 [Dendrothele bispora CBS 962.96]|uniref:Uncharacterized protein n=1 Tax=Dendrothele bispora (strain CBS 962.96) TaxID=1314807 RepID=A0A4S8L429_DENBC|nr:hypothetical protein K435DRAFT_871615 [Dendrothele bispora CBS 962.96]